MRFSCLAETAGPAGGPPEPAALRVLLRGADEHALALELQAPPKRRAVPANLSDADYARILAMPDRATRIGLRDHTLP